MIRSYLSTVFALMCIALPAQAQDFESVGCIDQSKANGASCEAICPAGKVVLNCGSVLGSSADTDTCPSLRRVGVYAAGSNGQPASVPHDRCVAFAECSQRELTTTAQALATCVTP